MDFLLHCYIDAEVDNKETFTKEFMWTLFEKFSQDIDIVSKGLKHSTDIQVYMEVYIVSMHLHVHTL